MKSTQCEDKRKTRTVSTFLKKTYELLNVRVNLTQDSENSECVRWAPSGVGFIIINEEAFSRTVLPKYFKHSNYSSFVRQVYLFWISSTCTISTRSVRIAKKATSTTNTLTLMIGMPWLKSSANLRKRKRKITSRKMSILTLTLKRRNSTKSLSPYRLTPKYTFPEKEVPKKLEVPRKCSLRRSLKICSMKKKMEIGWDCRWARVPINCPCRCRRKRRRRRRWRGDYPECLQRN